MFHSEDSGKYRAREMTSYFDYASCVPAERARGMTGVICGNPEHVNYSSLGGIQIVYLQADVFTLSDGLDMTA